MQKLIDKPIPPGEHDCCGNGCAPCVWDIYYEQQQRWQQQEAALRQSPPAARPMPAEPEPAER
jgi:hypothetical protein